MASFLTTSGVNQHLETLISTTQDRLILISPYLQFSDSIKKCIGGLQQHKPDIRIVYRENKLKDNEKNWLANQIGLRTSLCSSLHAKCYLNEKEAIITSMNLYEYSQLNNDEMGIYITRQQDSELYLATYREAKRLIQKSEEIRVTADAAIPVKQITDIKRKNGKDNFDWENMEEPSGYCIRTGVPIPFDLEKPLCKEAYNSWKKFGDIDYPEKYCHFSGESSGGKTSYDKPVLKKNWNKAQDVHFF